MVGLIRSGVHQQPAHPIKRIWITQGEGSLCCFAVDDYRKYFTENP